MGATWITELGCRERGGTREQKGGKGTWPVLRSGRGNEPLLGSRRSTDSFEAVNSLLIALLTENRLILGSRIR